MFKKWEATGPDGRPRYERQTEILDETFHDEAPSLDALLQRMRERGEPILYLLGTRLDHAYGLGSNDLSLLLSVLPEDGRKAAIPGYHPGSTEVYVPFQGSLVLERLVDGALVAETLGPFQVATLPPGQCHRVRYEANRPAASLVVKTNPHHEPKALRCDTCTYFATPAECILHQSWHHEVETT